MGCAETTFAGLDVDGWVEYEDEEGSTWGCGGQPAYWDAEIKSVTLADADEFHMTGIISDFAQERNLSDGTVDIIEAFHNITGRLISQVAEYAIEKWREDIEAALLEDYEND